MSVQAGERMAELEQMNPAQFQFVNARDLTGVLMDVSDTYADHEFWERASLAFSRMPTPVLKITSDTFSPDFLEKQFYSFASLRLREAFDLGHDAVRYRNVDARLSTSAVQARQYAVFDVRQYGNPFDRNKMLGEEREVRQPDGSLRREWIMDWENRMRLSPDVYFRHDFVAPAPLFKAVGSSWVFATDSLAERVMRAGITDMIFVDIAGSDRPLESRMRQPS